MQVNIQENKVSKAEPQYPYLAKDSIDGQILIVIGAGNGPEELTVFGLTAPSSGSPKLGDIYSQFRAGRIVKLNGSITLTND